MKRINILFLGGAKRVSLANHFINTGEKMDIDVHIFSYELSRRVPISSVGIVIEGKKWKDTDLHQHLDNVIRDYQIDIVLPFVDPAIQVAAVCKERNPNVFIPISDIDLCMTMFNKIESQEWFLSHGFPVPESYNINGIRYPAIFKPSTGSASKGIFIAKSPSDIPQGLNAEDFLIQEYIQNAREYTVDCYVTHLKKIISIVPRIRIETAGGEVVQSETIRNDSIEALSRRILETGDFHGPITIQFIENIDTNKVYIMEINPRLGGGVVTSIAAGANTPQFILEECCGIEPEKVENWRERTLISRYFQEVVFYADNH